MTETQNNIAWDKKAFTRRFIGILNKHGILLDLDDMTDRFKLHRLLLIASKFGLPQVHEYIYFVEGPFAPDLAGDIEDIRLEISWRIEKNLIPRDDRKLVDILYSTTGVPASLKDICSIGIIPRSFRVKEFIEFVRDRSYEELNILSSAIDIYEFNKERGINKEDIIEILMELFPSDRELIESLVNELIAKNIIKV